MLHGRDALLEAVQVSLGAMALLPLAMGTGRHGLQMSEALGFLGLSGGVWSLGGTAGTVISVPQMLQATDWANCEPHTLNPWV